MKKLLYLFKFLYLGTWGELSAQMLLFKGTFEEALKKAQAEKKDLFVDFYADWCGPCKALHPVLEELSKEYSGKVDIYQIDVDQEKELTDSDERRTENHARGFAQRPVEESNRRISFETE